MAHAVISCIRFRASRRLRSRSRRLRHSSGLVGMSGHDDADMGLGMVAGFIPDNDFHVLPQCRQAT